ncbi:MAG: DUF4384 domain-containing protein [Gammaproteobacteria bacterium]|nr:DUF4384 domain-containing protein [Gammaproteobacteria bacterium]
MKKKSTWLLASALLMAVCGAADDEAAERKGIWIGGDKLDSTEINNNLILVASINQAPGQTAKDLAESALETDIVFQYRHSGPEGVGKQEALDNGSILESGDKFTVEFEAEESLYVYLYHFDANGQLNELLSMSGYNNHVSAGKKVTLPSADKHFVLDDSIGDETIHTILSKTPLTGLEAKYKAKGLGNGDIEHRAKKGIRIREDKAPTETRAKENDTGRRIACLAEETAETACRESFVIHHVRRGE